ncbi:MAG: flagellar hook-length control protein FliK [Herbinix sp.]|nr:flagellar hook-length control protein FliK [Herbinix sp.]
MTTQSVMTQAANLFGNTAGSANVNGKQIGSGFELIINSSLKTAQDVSKPSDTTTVNRTSVKVTDTRNGMKSDKAYTTESQTDEKVQADNASNTENTKAPKVTKQKASTPLDNTKTTDDVENLDTEQTEELSVNEQIMAQIAVMLQSIQEVAMKALNLTTEEFNQLLTDQGMSVADLLQPENLQQLVLASKGETNILAALTDETLAGTIKQLLETVDGIKAESNLGLTSNQIKTILLQADTQISSQEETVTSETVAGEPKITSKDELQKQSEALNSEKVTVNNEDKAMVKTVTENRTQTETATTIATSEGHTGAQSNSNSEADRDLNASDQFQTFVDNLVNSSQNTQADFSKEIAQVTNLREIAGQIIERIKVSIAPNQTSMELQLNPENLGKVNLSVQSKDGVMTAHFVVQNELTKEAIESQIHTLRDTLNQQGIKVEAIEVTVSSNAFEQNNSAGSNSQEETQKNNSGKSISLEDALSVTEVSDNESNNEDITGIKGSVVDYTA